MIKKLLSTFLILTVLTFAITPDKYLSAEEGPSKRLGVWITVFSPEKVLYSRANVNKLISTCEDSAIDDIYLQVYRADKAYYDSGITDRSPHESILLEAKEDLIDYLIKRAHQKGIKVHAWMNCLSIAQNNEANIIKKFGSGVLTKDQYGRTPLKKGNKDKWDNYYIRENQLFLEAGDPRVRKYVTQIASEVLRKYPSFDGIHLDYIRYPSAVPFIPGSRFASHGLSYGYEEVNLNTFKAETGIDVKKLSGAREDFAKWDKFRRDNVSLLVKSISEEAKKLKADIIVSATIVPSLERTYLNTFQHWTRWLNEGFVDYVITMNYTDDADFMKLRTESMFLPDLKDKVQVGIGPYLLKKSSGQTEKQINMLLELSVPAVVLFSYDDVASNVSLQEFLLEKFGR